MQLLGEALDFIEKENLEYYHGRGVTLRLRPAPGDVLHLAANLSSGYQSTEQTAAPEEIEGDQEQAPYFKV